MCGIFGIDNHKEAANLTYFGLYALQHRGQESAGIVSTDFKKRYKHLGRGLVGDVFSDPESLQQLLGNRAIGHNRYSTTGADKLSNIQPFVFNYKEDFLAISHNGNLTNIGKLRKKLQEDGALFQTTSDTEVIVHLIAKSKKNGLIEKLKDAFQKIQGAYSLLIETKNFLIAARDPNGFHPLCIGKLDDSYVFASETCAFDIIGAEYLRDVVPGEIAVVENNKIRFEKFAIEKCNMCIFEYVYFSRPDSEIFGTSVNKTRHKLGEILAENHPSQTDIVISVPDSSNTAAVGFARTINSKFELGLIRNHYIGRSFIRPTQGLRDLSVKIKFNPVTGILLGRSVTIIDDSIVRGTTLKKLTQLIREAGAKSVHVRITSPPIKNPCFFGLDFPTQEELIAHDKTIEETREYLGVDSLEYMTIGEMLDAADQPNSDFCTACFSGKYPINFENTSNDKDRFEM